MKNNKFILIFLLSILLAACDQSPKQLPIIGFQEKQEDGSAKYHKIPPFSFVNQDSLEVNNSTFNSKIYVADFFFTSCPTICPKVMKQMIRIADSQKDNEQFMLISHTIDPKRDSAQILKKYANNLGIDQSNWHFLTGDQDKLLDIADDYYVVAYEDPSVPGGFDHSGKILLVDTKGHIRAFCDGTDEDSVTNFIKDIDILMNEHEG